LLLGAALVLLTVAAAAAWQLTRPRYEQVGEIWVHRVPMPLPPSERARLYGDLQILEGLIAAPPSPLSEQGQELETADAKSAFAEQMGHELLIPTWAPEGFVGGDRVVVNPRWMRPCAHAITRWWRPDGQSIVLMVSSLVWRDIARQEMGEGRPP
jgi:hypothetical protein